MEFLAPTRKVRNKILHKSKQMAGIISVPGVPGVFTVPGGSGGSDNLNNVGLVLFIHYKNNKQFLNAIP
jgi:hypothetical protein